MENNMEGYYFHQPPEVGVMGGYPSQEEQDQRIGGDGEEVFGYNNYLQRPAPLAAQGPLVIPPNQPLAAAPPSVGSGQGVGGTGTSEPDGYDGEREQYLEEEYLDDRARGARNGGLPQQHQQAAQSEHDHRHRERDRVEYFDEDYDDRGGRPRNLPSKGGNGTSRYDRSHRDHYEEDFDDRPRSRSSYHDDEYYSRKHRRSRRHGENYSFVGASRGPPSEYDPRDRGYSRRDRDPRSYGGYEYPSYNASFGMPPGGRYPYAPSMGYEQRSFHPQTQSFQAFLTQWRTENPVKYSEWYKKYMAHMNDPLRVPFPHVPGYGGLSAKTMVSSEKKSSEKNSLSGRNSVVDDSVGISGLDDSRFKPIKENTTVEEEPARNTPLMFPTSHAICSISSLGYLVRNRYGNSAVELINIRQMMKRLPEFKEMKAFPGPLIKDITHKNTIIQFCQRKIRDLEFDEHQLDKPNLVLLWELLILLLRQNGSAVGSDIAELLLKSKSAGQSLDSVSESGDYSSENEHNVEDDRKGRGRPNIKTASHYRSNDSDQKCVDVFCEKLLYGHKREALDYAMDNALWGHALFFASKMDEKLYGTVLARFANGSMSLNSPLQTLYHVLSGKQPPSITCCGDETFGDWKPHLAMLLSNMGQRPEFEADTMRTLGRTLANRNMKFAAQFCFLMGESEFSPESEIGVLLGYNPAINNLLEATQMTEVYEFARSLANPEFSLGSSFIESKINYTKELINLGFAQEAYSYCEEMTKSLRKNRIHGKEKSLAQSILYIAERLTHCDVSRGSQEPIWIEDLRKMTDQLDSETTSRKLSLVSVSDNLDEGSQTQTINYQINGPYDNYPLQPTRKFGDLETFALTPSVTTPSDTYLPGYPTEQKSGASMDRNQNPGPNQSSIAPSYQNSQETSSFQQTPISNGSINHPLSEFNTDTYQSTYKSMSTGAGNTILLPTLKRRVVRFEDEALKGVTSEMIKTRQLDNLNSKVVQEKTAKFLASSQEINRTRMLNPFHGVNNVERKLKDSPEPERSPSPTSSPIKFKSTFPIDQPILKSFSLNTFSTKKLQPFTYPVDKKCCDISEPCFEHNDYHNLNGYDNYNSRDKDSFRHNTFLRRAVKKPQQPFQQQPGRQNHDAPEQWNGPTTNIPAKKVDKPKTEDSSKSKQKKGWLNWLYPKNQMILPDDKEPAIVWDPVEKRWKNKSGDDDEDSGPSGPPPRDSDLMPPGASSNVPAVPPPVPNPLSFQQLPSNGLPTQTVPLHSNQQQLINQVNGNVSDNTAQISPAGMASNKFQRPKGIKLRNNYVDVFNTSANGTASKAEEPSVPLPPMLNQGLPNIFMPSSIPALDSGPTSFLTEASDSPEASNDVQAPPMFNPAQFQNNQNIAQPNYGYQ